MATNPTPPLPQNTSPVGSKTQRVQFQSGNTEELERFQRNVADKVDQLLSFVQNNFQMSAPTKQTGAAAVQAGSTQKAIAPTTSLSLKGQPSKVFIAPMAVGYAPANTLGSTTVTMQSYKPAGSTVAPTLDITYVCPAFAGTIVGAEVVQYIVAASAGTYQVSLVNWTQNTKTTALFAPKSYAQQLYTKATNVVTFNAGDLLTFKLTTAGWTQGATGGVEVRLWAQT